MLRVFRRPYSLALLAISLASSAGMGQDSSAVGEARRVEGAVSRGGPKGPIPVSGAWVVLHRVGPDRAGPLDSARTDARGHYAFRYRATGSGDALYFVSSSHDGIAYFTPPLARTDVRGDDAAIFVFDTTSAAVHINVIGRHLVVGAPDAAGTREVVEVLDLGNDSTVTRITGGLDHPVWSAPLPDGAIDPRVNPSGEVAASSVVFAQGQVRLHAPLSPGGRQFSYSYKLPRDALPLTLPLETGAGVLEVLLEEPRAAVGGVRLEEVAPGTSAGRTFRRFLARDVAAGSVIRVSVPVGVADVRARYLIGVVAVSGIAMIAGLAVAFRRRRSRGTVAPAPAAVEIPRASEALFQEIATLDARFARETAPSDEARARHRAERADLKARLAAALAAERNGG